MSKYTKAIAGFVGFATAVTMSFGTASAATTADLQAQITALLAQISSLQSQLGTTQTPVGTTAGYTFTKDLTVGSKGTDVTNLQTVLGVTPATGYFGAITKAALIKYQIAHAITPAAGYFGPKTRANFVGGTTGGTTTGGTTMPTGTAVSVALSFDNPAATTVIAGQSRADLAHFTFSNPTSAAVNVTKVILNRTGVASDSSLVNVYLYNGSTRVSDAASPTNGKITFSDSTGLFTIPAGGMVTISVNADIYLSATGQIVGVSMATAEATGVALAGVFPIMGNNMSVATVNSGDMATVTLVNNWNSSTATTPQSIVAGTLNQNIWDVTANVSKASTLKGITFKYVGSASNDAVANISLYVDGAKVGTPTSVNSNGYVVVDLTATPFVLTNGNHTLQLRGDFMKGSGRTAQFYVANATDFMIMDNQFSGVFVTPTIGSSAANTVYGNNFSISSGVLVVNQDPTWTATQVVGGATNVTVGKFLLKAYGEDIKVDNLFLTAVGTPTGYGSGNKYPNVVVSTQNGSFGGTKNVDSSLTALSYTPGSNLIIPAGTSLTLEVKADLRDGSGNNYTSGTVEFDITAGTTARGQSSSNSITVNLPVTGKQLTIGSATASFAKTGGFYPTTVAPNTANAVIGSFTVSNSNYEDIRVTNLLATTTGLSSMTYLSNMKVTDSGTVVAQPSGSDNFSMDVIVPVNTSHTFVVTADIGAIPTSQTIQLNAAISTRGVNSGITSNPGCLGVATPVTTGALYAQGVTKVSSSLTQQLYVGGLSGINLVTYNIKATTSPVTISEMTFTVAPDNNAITSITVGGVTKGISATTGNVITGLNIAIPAGSSGVDIPVTVTFGAISSTGLTSQNSATTYVTLTGLKFVAGNVTTPLTGLSLSSNSMQLVASQPTLTVSGSDTGLTVGGTLAGVENKIGSVTITADAHGSIRLSQLKFNFGTTGVGSAYFRSARIADGSQTIANTNVATTSTSAIVNFTSGTAYDATIVPGTGYTIPAGSSKTLTLYGTLEGSISGASGTASVSTSLSGNSASFLWDDVSGNGGTTTTGLSLTGANVYNFPTTSYTIHN